jgi:hypothetical protein
MSLDKQLGRQTAKVIAIIRQAFAETVYPSGVKLTNCSWNCDECAEISREFDGKAWSSLTDVKFLRHYSDALSLLQPEAFRYYLPAYMVGGLRDPATADVIPGSIEFHLTPPETKGADAEDWFAKFGQTKMDYFLSRVSGFSSGQKQAILAYLQLYFRLDPMEWHPPTLERRQRALHFWDTFEG